MKSVSHLVLVISLAGNFVVYSLANHAFRKVSYKMVKNASSWFKPNCCEKDIR